MIVGLSEGRESRKYLGSKFLLKKNKRTKILVPSGRHSTTLLKVLNRGFEKLR